MRAGKDPGLPPAATAPVLLQSNRIAWRIFCELQSQVITGGFGGVLGIDLTTLPWRMELHGVPEELWAETDHKVQVLANQYVKAIGERRKDGGQGTHDQASRKR